MILNWKDWSIAGTLVLAAALAVWLALPSIGELSSTAPAVERHDEGATRAAKPETFLTSPPTIAQPSPPLDSPMDLHAGDPQEHDGHPHPITPEHERIFAENRTVGALNDAMSLRDVKKMRQLLADYQKLDPSDIEASQAGYAVIADCIEFPGETSLAAASHFYDTERHSPLRRFVRRICFENAD